VARIITRPVMALYTRFLSGPAARVADAHAALHQGLHHLIQYLAFLRGEDESRLTARADMPRLIQTSRDLLERVELGRSTTEEQLLLAATPRNRLVWLSRFLHAPLAERSHRVRGVLGAAALIVLVAIVLAALVRDAIDYHPRYLAHQAEVATPTKEQ
jgi:hypothetical protein